MFLSMIENKLEEALHDDRIGFDENSLFGYTYVWFGEGCTPLYPSDHGGYGYKFVFDVPETFSTNGKASFECSPTDFATAAKMGYNASRNHPGKKYAYRHWYGQGDEIDKNSIELSVMNNGQMEKRTVTFDELDRQVQLAIEQKAKRQERYAAKAETELGITDADAETKETLQK